MNAILDRVKRNPVLLLDLVKALVVIATLFGLPLPPGVDIAVSALLVAGLSLVTRNAVTPNVTVAENVDEALNTPVPDLVPLPTLDDGSAVSVDVDGS